jgi:hypothetical protein
VVQRPSIEVLLILFDARTPSCSRQAPRQAGRQVDDEGLRVRQAGCELQLSDDGRSQARWVQRRVHDLSPQLGPRAQVQAAHVLQEEQKMNEEPCPGVGLTRNLRTVQPSPSPVNGLVCGGGTAG